MVNIDMDIFDSLLGKHFSPILRVVLIDLANHYDYTLTKNSNTPFSGSQPVQEMGLVVSDPDEVIRYLNHHWRFDRTKRLVGNKFKDNVLVKTDILTMRII